VLGPAAFGMGRDWLLEVCPSFICFTVPNWVALCETIPFTFLPYKRNYGDQLKNLTLRVLPFKVSQGHKVIRTDMDRSGTYDFLPMFHNNQGSILYHFQCIARYWPKITNFPHPTPIWHPADEILWNWVTALVLKKLDWCATRPRIMSDIL